MERNENIPRDPGGPIPVEFSHIKGWEIDADRKNDPTYPIKLRTDEEQRGYTWERPPLQTPEVEILHSNERPNLTAVFGSPNPPAGLSGFLRRTAFNYSESSYGHWVPLLLADRVDMVEGVLDDLRHAIVPNVFAELGWSAEWKHNKKSFVKRAAVAALLTTAVVLIARRQIQNNKQRT
jgi:hypothetical protein